MKLYKYSVDANQCLPVLLEHWQLWIFRMHVDLLKQWRLCTTCIWNYLVALIQKLKINWSMYGWDLLTFHLANLFMLGLMGRDGMQQHYLSLFGLFDKMKWSSVKYPYFSFDLGGISNHNDKVILIRSLLKQRNKTFYYFNYKYSMLY